jgi:hypothetical protein
MANLIELSKMAESMPDEQLVQAAQGQGSFPAYVAITEVKRRADLRKAYDAQVAQAEMPQATVAEQVISEYVQPGLQGMAQQAMPPQPQGFQEGGSTAFTPKSYEDFLVETDQKGYFGLGNLKKPDMDAIDKYLLSAGLDPQVLAGLSKMQKFQYISKVKDYQERSLPEGFKTADPISAATVNIDQSPEVVPGSETKEMTEPVVDQPPVSSLSDFTQVMDLINQPLNVESTPVAVPQSVQDLRDRVAAKKDKPIEGLQAIDIPIKSAEEKQNEREVSALGDLAIAISGAKNLGELGVGLGQASKGVQAIKDKQEAQTLDAQLKQRELQRQDIEFTRAQEADIDESLNKIAGLDVKLQEAQTLQDDKAYERAFNEKKTMVTALNDVTKLKIYEAQIAATNNKAVIEQGRGYITLYNTLTTQLKDAITADERAAIQGQLTAVMQKIDSDIVKNQTPSSDGLERVRVKLN